MDTYVYIGHDGPNGAALRPTIRDAHLAHLEGHDAAGRVIFAGPLRNEDGAPCGSLIVFRADDFASARKLAESDPYLSEGVFDRVEVHASTQVFPKT